MICCSPCKEPVQQDFQEELDMESNPSKDEKERRRIERNLMQTISNGIYENIEKLVTPRTLQKCESNTLLLSMKVNYKLRKLAETIGPDAVRLERLANSVEEFTYRLLDPLKTDLGWSKQFGDYSLDEMLIDALEFKQKKLFTHPRVHSEMNRKWHGRALEQCKPWQLNFLTIWCLFDLVFSPILLAVFSVWRNWIPEERRGKRDQPLTVSKVYLAFLESPKYKFLRDTLSYIIMLFLHYALCLSPSTIVFSGLEWAILAFYIGRSLVELKQISGVKQFLTRSRQTEDDDPEFSHFKIFSVYFSDCWNRFDFTSLVIYSIILILRIVTWVNGGSVANNRTLIIAGYLYSFNTLCLTLRAFGQVMEQQKDVGTIQIALFSIVRDVRTVLWQFLAVILAFSIAITKIYMSERSFIANKSERHEIACKKPGLPCWWAMFSHLGLSLLDHSEESDPMTSVDPPTVILAQIFYVAFLILGVVLLINMLIALLSNTYQKTEDNAVREWSFKRAVAIQTFDGYDPIPVPLNIIYRIFITPLGLYKKKDEMKTLSGLEADIEDLEEEYFAENEDFFSIADEMKIDYVFRETEKNSQLISQILSTTFAPCSSHKLKSSFPDGKAWKLHPGIRMEGPLLTFKCRKRCKPSCRHYHGARYGQPFSLEFPHFEVVILETGRKRWLGIGIVNEGYNDSKMPGWIEESVGYHTDDGNIFHNADDPDAAIITEGRKPCEQHTSVRFALLSEHRFAHPRRPRGSRSSREGTWDGGFQVRADRRALGYRLSPDNFRNFERVPASDWAREMLCVVVPNRRTHLMSSCVFVCSCTTAVVSITACLAHAPKKCTQSGNVQFDMKSPSFFKILSARKLYKESLFQKYSLQLTTGIHIFSVFIVIIPTRLLCQIHVNSSGAEFLSTVSKFMKRMNYVIACLRPSQKVKSGIFLGSRAVDGKEVYKKV